MADGSHQLDLTLSPLPAAIRCADFFAGIGGFTEGARAAGCNVVYAANHWPAAVSIHQANHPEAVHVCQDLQQANMYDLPEIDLLLASPACQGHSPARGKDRPHHDALRSTAWSVPSALEAKDPYAFIVENVPEFLDWKLYPSWADAISRLGYAQRVLIIDAADHGVPQHRRRVFIVGTRSRSPITLDLPRREHVGIGSVIDFEGGRWSPIEKPGRAENTLARIAAGRKAHGSRFVAPYYGSGSGVTGRSLARPIGTLTTRDRWSVIDGDRMRMLSVEEQRAAMSFRKDYLLPENRVEATFMLGNAVAPVVATDLINALRAAA